jgi:excisionase family DNA binding protein
VPGMCPSVNKAETLRALVAAAAPGELPALAGELARGLADVLARAAAPAAPLSVESPRNHADDALLTVDEAAERLGVARSWLYRHAKALPFTKKLGRRTLRFDVHGLERWVNSRA